VKKILMDLWRYLEPEGTSSRVFIGLYMVTTGIMRMITGNSVTSVNVFSARSYGFLLLLGGLFLLMTTHHVWRCHWPGRLAAIFCATLWLLIIANAWSAQAWVSISGAFVFVLALGNEVRIHEC
jgi:hypothetical protein